MYDVTALAVNQPLSGPTLDTWPTDVAAKLDKLIADNANSGSYACFDADQTSYQWDLEESIFAFLEMKNVLTREKLEPGLHLIPFLDTANHTETLVSYYYRLCTAIDDAVCYTWSAQVFSGMTLKELKTYVDEMLQSNTGNATIKTILTTANNNSIVQTEFGVPIPNFYNAQRELYNRLLANGIEVYVITASQEELIRMVLADPKYGYNVKPQNVIGVATLLRSDTQWTTSRKAIRDHTYNQTQQLDWKITSYLWSPQAMFSGKYGAIMTYIDQWKMPVLVAGDTPLSDGYMLFHAYNQQRGTIRLWINRKDAYLTLIKEMTGQYATAQQQNNLTVTADKNWIYVTPNELGPNHGVYSSATNASKSSSFTVITTTTQNSRNIGNEAFHYQYQLLLSLILLLIIYF